VLATAVPIHKKELARLRFWGKENIFLLTTSNEILDLFLCLPTVSMLDATIAGGKQGFGHPDLTALPALFSLFKRYGLLLGNKRLPNVVWQLW